MPFSSLDTVPQTFFWRGVHTPHAEKMAGLIVQVFPGRTSSTRCTEDRDQGLPLRSSHSSIDPTRMRFPFEMMEEVIRKVQVIAVVHCPCRVTAHLIRKKRCDHALEKLHSIR